MKEKYHSPVWNAPTAPMPLPSDYEGQKAFFEALKPLMDTAVDLAREMPDLRKQVGHLIQAPMLSAFQANSACQDILHYLEDHLGAKEEEHPILYLLMNRLRLLVFQAMYNEHQRLGRILPDAKERVKTTRGLQQGGRHDRKRHVIWEEWCKMALEIRQKHPTWSCLRVARKIKEDGKYKDAVNTIRPRITHLF